jgi:hypothetical protein
MVATARVVDLTGVKDGGNFRPKRRPEGEYKAKIVKVDDHTPKKEGAVPGWVLTIQVDGDARSTYPYYLSPEAKQVWKIGNICRAAGLNTKNAKIKFDPNRLVNRALGILLMDDEFNDKIKSAIDEVFPVSDLSPNADEEGPADDEDEIVEDEPEPEEEEEDEEPEPEPVKPVRRRKPAPAPEPEPEDEEEEDEEEPPPPPRKTVRRKATPPPPPVDDDEEDEDLDLDDLD